jgi:aminopeptidase
MKDPRTEKLADILVNYSIKARPGEKVLIQGNNAASPGGLDLVKALIRAVYKAGALPFVWTMDHTVERELLLGATEEQVNLRAKVDGLLMDNMDCYIGFTAWVNQSAQSDVPAEAQALWGRCYNEPVHMGKRLTQTRWVVLRFPTPATAQAAHMSEEAFEDFFYRVSCFDYAKMGRAMEPLKALLEKTDRVRIYCPPTPRAPRGTDLSFSIKGLPAVPCAGGFNIPDGEVFTAPVKESVNGIISYNTPSGYQGFVFDKVCLTFKDGKIVEASANDTKRINAVFDTDAGARYVGEFAFGVNPYILEPMNEILFDEKIAGSIHFTPGNSYDECDNTNKSGVHWDLVLIQRPEYGGGEIWFDDVLVRKDGLFVLPELIALNPDHLL